MDIITASSYLFKYKSVVTEFGKLMAGFIDSWGCILDDTLCLGQDSVATNSINSWEFIFTSKT